MIESNKLLIIGGFNVKNINQVCILDLSNGEKEIISESNDVYWSILPMICSNNLFYFFPTGEDLSTPEHFTFELK